MSDIISCCMQPVLSIPDHDSRAGMMSRPAIAEYLLFCLPDLIPLRELKRFFAHISERNSSIKGLTQHSSTWLGRCAQESGRGTKRA